MKKIYQHTLLLTGLLVVTNLHAQFPQPNEAGTRLVQVFFEGAWLNAELETRITEDVGQFCIVTENSIQEWNMNENQWDAASYSNMTYYSAEYFKDSTISQIFDPVGMQWNPYRRYVWSYNADNTVSSYLSQIANGDTWVNSILTTYDYDLDGNLTGKIQEGWDDVAAQWEWMWQWAYTNNANGQPDTVLLQEAFLVNVGVWTDYTLSTYTYNEYNLETTRSVITWWQNEWLNDTFHERNYNLQNQLVEEWISICDLYSQIWTSPQPYDEYTYYEDGTLWTHTNYYINNEINVTEPGDLLTYSNYCLNLDVQENAIFSGTLIFPNPATSQFQIESSSQNISSIIIHDVLGKEIFRASCNSSNFEVNTSQWHRGVYFVKIILDEGEMMRKVVVE